MRRCCLVEVGVLTQHAQADLSADLVDAIKGGDALGLCVGD